MIKLIADGVAVAAYNILVEDKSIGGS